MARIALALLLAVHGALHFLGFLKAWKLAVLPQLTGRSLVSVSETMTRVVGLWWLLAAVLFLAAGTCALTRRGSWWLLAGPALLLSQALVVFQWSDAQAGTVANVLIAVAVAIAAAGRRFERRVDREVLTLLAAAGAPRRSAVLSEELAPLPPPVRRWLEVSGVVGSRRAHTVRLRQRGSLRTGADQAWLAAEAQQYVTVDPPAFVWQVSTRMKGLPVAGRDRYADGRGHMLIKLASVLNVVDASDDKIAQGALLRWLGEIVWYPSAALARSVAWRTVDDHAATATVSDRGLTATALFSFDERGRFSGLTAERFLGGGPGAALRTWRVSARAWRVVRGIEIPVEGDVTWRLPEGDFSYYRWEILDVEYDPAAPYPASRPACWSPAAGSAVRS